PEERLQRFHIGEQPPDDVAVRARDEHRGEPVALGDLLDHRPEDRAHQELRGALPDRGALAERHLRADEVRDARAERHREAVLRALHERPDDTPAPDHRIPAMPPATADAHNAGPAPARATGHGVAAMPPTTSGCRRTAALSACHAGASCSARGFTGRTVRLTGADHCDETGARQELRGRGLFSATGGALGGPYRPKLRGEF